LGTWGPGTIDVSGSAGGVPIVDGAEDGLAPLLVGCDLENTRIRVEWLDGSAEYQKRVRVTVSTPYQPFMFFLIPVTLSASSTMPVAH
jgi:hypothetical protein